MFNIREPLKFVGDGSKLGSRTNLENDKGLAMTQGRDLKYDDGEDGEHVDDSQFEDTAFHALSSNPEYPKAGDGLHYNDENLQMIEDDYGMFDRNRMAYNTNFNNLETGESYFKSHGDVFPCPPCSCSHTAGRSVIANCTGKKIYNFPSHLPKNTVVLHLTSTKIRTLNISSFLTYPSLVNVSVQSNPVLTNISRGYETNKTLPVLYLNMVDCEISNIENASLSIMPFLTNLTLRKNQLPYLTRSMFEGLDKLESLDVSNNRIQKIEVGTFDNLPKLKVLDLSTNPQFGYSNKSLSHLLFKNLKHLRKLSLHGYQALEQLVNLQELGIDGLQNPAEFGPGMKSLKHLIHLQIGGGLHNCKIENLTETFFDNVPYLRSFVLELCLQFVSVHPNAYARLTNLAFLKLQFMKNYDIDDAFKDLTAFNNSLILGTEFDFWNTWIIYRNVNFKTKQIYNGKQIMHLTETVDTETKLNKCGGDVWNGQPMSISRGDDIKNNPEIKRKPKIIGSELRIPPKLRILKASRYNVFGMQILANRLSKNNSLSVVDFSDSFMTTWGLGMLPSGITQANLANNYCKTITKRFFQANNSHSRLILNNNFLGPDFAKDDLGDIFANLNNTVYLDISTNLIYKLPRNFFKGLSNLKYLKVSDNKIAYLNTSLRHMKNLQFIDLARNNIHWISEETRNYLDVIASLPGHTIELDLTLNPLPCTCAGLDLIAWMATTNVHFSDKNLLKCDTDSMVSEQVVDMEKRRQILQRLCVSKTALIIGCVAALTVAMISVGFGLMYRYRWKLRYFHNIAIAAVFGFNPDIHSKSGCTFDAYLVYTKETQDFVTNTCIKELEIKRGHRLCVEDRDFLAGTYTISNIVSAVRNSTRTVPVLTPTFYNGVFSEYSFQMAVMEELYKDRCVLHLLLYKPIPSEQMSHDELAVMKRNSYIEYPPEEEADENIRQKFWDDLSLAIGHTDNPTPRQLLNIQ
ncbi:unnamed protein product [Candidula unifasciata]|uniref:TIR domain-containing protein n=1 Tax=Candidula unifasciata TaxID=100452 RepID=A0A8S3ZGC3_9EUPU|nr:unnamed protein product [Candidula unifasciata]